MRHNTLNPSGYTLYPRRYFFTARLIFLEVGLAAALERREVKRSMRPAVSISFSLPG